jgi:NAD(P)-dependent dehydrogenase (short-subunit alcohol dehydrogenase family)
MDKETSLMAKIALITGANRGLGFEVARQLAQAGHTVVLGARDPQKGDEAAQLLRDEGLTAEALTLEVDDIASVKRAAAELRERHGQLDVLVNNAGVLPEATAAPAEVIDAGLFRETFDTNLIGAVGVTEQLLPLLRQSQAGRIVNVSTTMGSLADQSDPESPHSSMIVPAYRASKAALNSVTVSLSRALADTPIKVNSVCPGFVQTDLTPVNRDQAPVTAADAARVVVRYALVDDGGPSGGFFDHKAVVAW